MVGKYQWCCVSVIVRTSPFALVRTYTQHGLKSQIAPLSGRRVSASSTPLGATKVCMYSMMYVLSIRACMQHPQEEQPRG